MKFYFNGPRLSTGSENLGLLLTPLALGLTVDQQKGCVLEARPLARP